VMRLLSFRHSSQCILKRNSNFGFQGSFFCSLLIGQKTQKPIEFAKVWNFGFGTGFGR
jgi:hypothetical protein